MALDQNGLKAKIRDALDGAKKNNWNLDQVAAAWAQAIHDYVKVADVKDVTCNVAVDVNVPGHGTQHGTGTATQTGFGKLA